MRNEQKHGRLGFGKNALRDRDASRAQRRHSGCSAAFHAAALGQNLMCWLGFLREGGRPEREALAPLADWTKVDMEEARARVLPVDVPATSRDPSVLGACDYGQNWFFGLRGFEPWTGAQRGALQHPAV